MALARLRDEIVAALRFRLADAAMASVTSETRAGAGGAGGSAPGGEIRLIGPGSAHPHTHEEGADCLGAGRIKGWFVAAGGAFLQRGHSALPRRAAQ
jgi:hypothetical protein